MKGQTTANVIGMHLTKTPNIQRLFTTAFTITQSDYLIVNDPNGDKSHALIIDCFASEVNLEVLEFSVKKTISDPALGRLKVRHLSTTIRQR